MPIATTRPMLMALTFWGELVKVSLTNQILGHVGATAHVLKQSPEPECVQVLHRVRTQG